MTEFRSAMLKIIDEGKAYLYSSGGSVVRVIFIPKFYEKSLNELQATPFIDGSWDDYPTARTYELLKAPIRWKEGQIFLELKEK